MNNATIVDDYSAFIGHNAPDEMAQLSILAEEQRSAELKVENLESQLKEAKEQLREIAEKKIPEKMDALNLSSYTTTSGLQINVKEVIRASLSEENRPKGLDWLEKEGAEALIKSEVRTGFGRTEIQAATQLVEELRKRNFVATLERNVHPQTLLAFIRERLAQGKEVPVNIFGVLRQRISKVELPKEKKSRKSMV